MSKSPGVPPRGLRRCAASVLLLLTSCSQVPPTSSAVIPPIPAGAARIWVYRNDGPYDSQNRPYLRLNGQVAGISEPNGALFFTQLVPAEAAQAAIAATPFYGTG